MSLSNPAAGVGSLSDFRVISEKYAAFLRKVLEFGPKVPEFTGHIQEGVLEFKAAGDLAIAHFGLSAESVAAVQVNWEEVCRINDCATLEQQVTQKVGVAAREGFRETFAWLLQSGLLEFIMKSFLKTP